MGLQLYLWSLMNITYQKGDREKREVGESQSAERPSESERQRRAERVVVALAVLSMCVSVVLFFRQLPLTGLTWDEWADYSIANDYYLNRSFLQNQGDPSQARLSHLLAAGSFALLGVSYLAFKLPFVFVGLVGGLVLWLFLRQLVRPVVAAFGTAMYLSCPFVLAASRAGATAGDSLVCVLTLGFIITLRLWVCRRRFWPYGALCGVVCGLAIGAKWTSGLLLLSVVFVWLLQLRREKQAIFSGTVWAEILAQQWIAVSLGVLASPTLLLGLPFVESALGHSMQFGNLAMLQFGENRTSSPFYYIPAVLISKLSPVQLALVVYECALGFVWLIRFKRRIGSLPIICLVSLLPVVPLAMKGFQNAHYYVVFVPAVMVTSSVVVDRWLRSLQPKAHSSTLSLMVFAVVAQLALSIILAPDYLMAGRQFGHLFYSQFAGPAVNHCQGLVYASQEVDELSAAGGTHRAFILHSCVDVMLHNLAHGPFHAKVPISPYPSVPPKLAHYLVIPTSFDYDNLNARERVENAKLRKRVTEGCHPVGKGHVDYSLWFCPSKMP